MTSTASGTPTLIDLYGREHALPGPYATVRDVKVANAAAGHFYFSPDTMRWFDGRTHGRIVAGRLVITSEQQGGFPRAYGIAVAADDGTAARLSETTYVDETAARNAAHRAARLAVEAKA